MAARKLQSEIDRTLKKVSEGVELFEGIYDKMQSTTNLSQKEKLELDLKTQIKKLQRLRDQIKTWVAGNEIKDKSALVDNRKLIETQMERFKACEKEMKTKAYSKAGLTQAAILDPKEQEKEEATTWLRSQVEELQMQVEQAEAEIEALQGTAKKRKTASAAAGRQEELEHLNERRKWHIGRLEIILRLVENGTLPVEKVQGLKEDVSYFVESNTDENFDEDDGIYDDLNLDEEDAKFGNAPEDDDESDESDGVSEDIPPRTPSKKHDKDEESVTSSKREESPILKKANQSLQMRKSSVDASKPPPNPNFAQQPMSSILKAGLPSATTSRGPAQLPPIRYAAAAAAAVAPHPPAAQVAAQSSTQSSVATTSTTATSATGSHPPTSLAAQQSTPQPSISDQMSHVTSSPSLTHPSVTSPMLSSAASVSQQPDGSFYSGQESPAMSEAVAVSPIVSKESASSPPKPTAANPNLVLTPADAPATSSQVQPPSSAAPQPGPSPLPQQLQQFATNVPAPNPSVVAPPSAQQPQFPPGVKVPGSDSPAVARPVSSASPGQQRPLASLTDLVSSYESVKQKAHNRSTNLANLDQVNKLLEGSYGGIPQPQDTERPKYYVPRNPYQTPHYYPQVPHPLLSTPAIFSQLDIETLFYVFYYMPGTFSQYLAAKELKRQSWRFHVKYLTWFQRHSEPQAITEEYEQGVYVYFDWEGSWCQRKKSDFRFEYRYLSEE